MPLLYRMRDTPPCCSNLTTTHTCVGPYRCGVYAISSYRVARRAQRYAGGRGSRGPRTGPSSSAQVPARRFYRGQRPPDFEGIGSPEIGEQYAMQIRARPEELTFALSPTVIDRHKIRSGRSEADAQPRTGGSSRRGRWAARTVALRQCFIEGPGVRARCDRPVGPLTVVMETLPFGLCFPHRSHRAAARASYLSSPIPRR